MGSFPYSCQLGSQIYFLNYEVVTGQFLGDSLQLISSEKWAQAAHSKIYPPCLQYIFSQEFGESTLELNNLRVDPNCFIPPLLPTSADVKGAGNCLLSYAKQLAKYKYGANKITLMDASTVFCHQNKINTATGQMILAKYPLDLQVMHVLRDGQTWYESKGFTFSSDEKTKLYFQKLKIKLKHLTLEEFFSEVIKAQQFYPKLIEYALSGTIIKTFLEILQKDQITFPQKGLVQYINEINNHQLSERCEYLSSLTSLIATLYEFDKFGLWELELKEVNLK
jgi:hypothetical protein